MNVLDCGDSGCYFKERGSGGMRTNGGCRCFGHPVYKAEIRLRLADHKTLTKQLEIATGALDKINGPEKCGMPRLIWNDIARQALAEIEKLKENK